MRTLYIALLGADGADGYKPLHPKAVTVPDGTGLSVLAAIQSCGIRLGGHAPHKITEERDADYLKAAKAWGYEHVWNSDTGPCFLTSTTAPRTTTPDPDYAWWLKPHEVRAIREKYLKPPAEDNPDTRTEHPHRRTDGMTYRLEDREKIKNRCAELLSERGIVCEETVRVVLSIHGDSLDTLNDILEHETGENDIMDYFADELEAAGLVSRADEQEDDDEDTGSDE